MLGHPSIQRYSFTSLTPFVSGVGVGSENPSGADNQQETALQDPQRLYVGLPDKPQDPVPNWVGESGTKIQSDPHGDMRS